MANVITAKMENLFCEHLEQDAPLCLFLLSDGKGYSKTGGFVRTQQYQYDTDMLCADCHRDSPGGKQQILLRIGRRINDS